MLQRYKMIHHSLVLSPDFAVLLTAVVILFFHMKSSNFVPRPLKESVKQFNDIAIQWFPDKSQQPFIENITCQHLFLALFTVKSLSIALCDSCTFRLLRNCQY